MKKPDNNITHQESSQDGQNAVPVEQIVSMTQIVSGPLPSAEQLAGYEKILPGAAERIFQWQERQISLVESQASHRMSMESGVVSGDAKRAWAGLVIGGIIVLFFGGIACYLGINGHDVLAGVIAGIDIASIVGVFVYGTNSRRAERHDRLKILAPDVSDKAEE